MMSKNICRYQWYYWSISCAADARWWSFKKSTAVSSWICLLDDSCGASCFFYNDYQWFEFIFCLIISLVFLLSWVNQVNLTRFSVADNFHFLLDDCTTPTARCFRLLAWISEESCWSVRYYSVGFKRTMLHSSFFSSFQVHIIIMT
jgi:hypothetical protein